MLCFPDASCVLSVFINGIFFEHFLNAGNIDIQSRGKLKLEINMTY